MKRRHNESYATRVYWAEWDKTDARTQMGHGSLGFRAEWFLGWVVYSIRLAVIKLMKEDD